MPKIRWAGFVRKVSTAVLLIEADSFDEIEKLARKKARYDKKLKWLNKTSIIGLPAKEPPANIE